MRISHNFLVSPYYPLSGGTVIDWMPLEWADESDDEEGSDKLDGLDDFDDLTMDNMDQSDLPF